jgi:two-component system, OmpR family, response regulator
MTESQKTVMVVDDDVDLVLELQLQLEAAGYRVVTAHTDKDGRRVADEQHPDAAVIDLMMEEHDSGFALSHHLKRHLPQMPVILLTAVASETGIDFDATTAEERSWIKADMVLDKPVRFEILAAQLRRLLA